MPILSIFLACQSRINFVQKVIFILPVSNLFIDLENINLEKKNKNIIILPESYYYCILCDYSEIKTNVKVYDNLLKINKDRIIIESELYSDYSKIASPIFELRCSLNENEAAEILKKIAN